MNLSDDDVNFLYKQDESYMHNEYDVRNIVSVKN